MPDLSSNSKKFLLNTARESLTEYFRGGAASYETKDPELLQNAGCFVTLRKRGVLRGCVGTFDRGRPLIDNVRRMTRAAAFQDSRFPALNQSELGEVQIHISVLTEPKRIEDLSSLELGRHGIIVKFGSRSGTLLPEVPIDMGWNLEQFVMCCAREKAGLTPEECSGAEIYSYETIKFAEPG